MWYSIKHNKIMSDINIWNIKNLDGEWEIDIWSMYPHYLHNYEFLSKTISGEESSHGPSMRILISQSLDLTFFF